MKYHHLVLFCSALASILSTRGAYSDAKVTIYTNLHADPEVIHFSAKKTLTLHCNTTESGDITWEKGGKPVKDIKDLKDRVSFKEANNSTLVLKDLKEGDVGNYTCVVGTSRYTDTVALATASSAKWGVRVAKNINVVEAEKLTIKCDVRGELTLRWFYTNTTSGGNKTSIGDNDPRYKLSNYHDDKANLTILNGELRIDEVDMGDRGDYTCEGLTDGALYESTCTVRIKDKYAALWPFLGICAEVFVLCAIIFIYEKKRNKTELEESDTDQSPDQKNTPDLDKESNLRHRQ